MNTSISQRRAWGLVLAATLTLMVTMGIRQSLGLFVQPIHTDLMRPTYIHESTPMITSSSTHCHTNSACQEMSITTITNAAQGTNLRRL